MGVYNEQYMLDEVQFNPEKMAIVKTVKDNMSAGLYSQDYIDFFYQQDNRGRDSHNLQYWVFSQLHSMVLLGHIAICDIEIGEEPSRDDLGVEEMHPILQSLGDPFTGNFSGGTQGEDGNLEWNQPIDFSILGIDSHTQDVKPETIIQLPPNSVSLECGTQNAVKTLTQIKMERGLARWPYGSTKIRIFKLLDKFAYLYMPKGIGYVNPESKEQS